MSMYKFSQPGSSTECAKIWRTHRHPSHLRDIIIVPLGTLVVNMAIMPDLNHVFSIVCVDFNGDSLFFIIFFRPCVTYRYMCTFYFNSIIGLIINHLLMLMIVSRSCLYGGRVFHVTINEFLVCCQI